MYLQVREVILVEQKEEGLSRRFQGLVVRSGRGEDEKLSDVFHHVVEVGIVHSVQQLEGSRDLHLLENCQREANQVVLRIRITVVGQGKKRVGERVRYTFHQRNGDRMAQTLGTAP